MKNNRFRSRVDNLFWGFRHSNVQRIRRASLLIKRARNYFLLIYGEFRFWHQGASLKQYLDDT